MSHFLVQQIWSWLIQSFCISYMVCTLLFCLFIVLHLFWELNCFHFLSLFYLCSIIISKQGAWCIGSIVVLICSYCTLKDKFYCQIFMFCCLLVPCLHNTPFLTIIALTFYSRQGKLKVKRWFSYPLLMEISSCHKLNPWQVHLWRHFEFTMMT